MRLHTLLSVIIINNSLNSSNIRNEAEMKGELLKPIMIYDLDCKATAIPICITCVNSDLNHHEKFAWGAVGGSF